MSIIKKKNRESRFWYREDIEKVTNELTNDELDIAYIRFLDASEGQLDWGCLSNGFLNLTNGMSAFFQIILRQDDATGEIFPVVSTPSKQNEEGEWEREYDFGYLVNAQILKAFEERVEVDYEAAKGLFDDSIGENLDELDL